MHDNKYELCFLSDLRKKSRHSQRYESDFKLVLEYIFQRMDAIADVASTSQFNTFIQLLRRFVPNFLLITILNRFRYDSIVGIRKDDDGKRVYCMISFQKHPACNMIGMFDIYVNPEDRGKHLRKFRAMAEMIDELCKRYRKNGYLYLQCGNNDSTRSILRIFGRICKKEYPDIGVDIEKSRILLV
ncbi:hypothetical protein [Candidatus Uabimicrobium sp. HlEnr_7]|uniref:hypothetical protein n=1 Tax=Candidatus Uabimicrobium helgolandensis TaxID=3095367 RepID=UPI003557104D